MFLRFHAPTHCWSWGARVLDEKTGAGSSKSRCHWGLDPRDELRGRLRVSLVVDPEREIDRVSWGIKLLLVVVVTDTGDTGETADQSISEG